MTRGKETYYPECRKKDRPILSGIQANALLRRNAWPYGRQIKERYPFLGPQTRRWRLS